MPDLTALENLFLGLADKTRLRVLTLMADGPVPVAHLVAETGENQPKISRHLAYLRNSGLVDTTRDGKWIYYGLADLNDSAADAVFRCVMDELGGTAVPRKPLKQRDRPQAAERVSEPDRPFIEDDVPYTEPGTEWTRPTEEPREELEIFLL
jgi:DNA-binding transcriptional ArsR family regulator